jgi:prepilin-type N-terminal cleavage/methylation domain-containing protein
MVSETRTVARRRFDRGFSLVELLVAMTISIMVVGGAAMLGGQVQSSYRAQMESATAQQEGRYAIEWIERYLRAAGNNPYRVLTTPCPAAGTPFQAIRLDPNGNGQNDDIRLQMDANPTNGLIGGAAGACNEGNEDVTIAYNAANRSITLLDNVLAGPADARTDQVIAGLQFVYRNPQRVVTNVAGQIAFIETRVTVRSKIDDRNLGAPVTYVVSSEVRVRSR